MLYSSGTGYFEYTAEVDGNQTVRIALDDQDLNDVLKTLMVEDTSGGKIRSVDYDREATVDGKLNTLELDVQNEASIASIFERLRGEHVQITVKGLLGGETIQGTIVGLESSPKMINLEPIVVEQVVLLVGEDLRRVAVHEISAVRFDDPQWNQQIADGLSRLQASRKGVGTHELLLRCEGSAKRQIRIGFVRETPIWKVTYRLILAADGDPLLFGWAIVENETGDDWRNVQITLVHGQPTSFRMDLREALFVERTEIDVPVDVAGVPAVHERPDAHRHLADRAARSVNGSEVLNAAGGFMGGMGMGMGGFGGGMAGGFGGGGFGGGGVVEPITRESGESLGKSDTGERGRTKTTIPQVGVAAGATGEEVAAFFQYTIDVPVTIVRQRSQLIPFLKQTVNVEKFSLYSESNRTRHPSRVVSIRNSTPQDLAQGPIIVFDEENFAGEGLMGFLPRGEARLVSYGIDTTLVVRPGPQTSAEEFTAIELDGPQQLKTQVLTRVSGSFSVQHHGPRKARLLIELPRTSGATWERPGKPYESTENYERFLIPVEADVATVQTVQATPSSGTVDLKSQGTELLREWLQQKSLKPNAREHIEKLLELRIAIRDAQRKQEISAAAVRQQESAMARIRANIGALQKDDPLYRKFADKLDMLEVELDALQTESFEKKQETDALSHKLEALTGSEAP